MAILADKKNRREDNASDKVWVYHSVQTGVKKKKCRFFRVIKKVYWFLLVIKILYGKMKNPSIPCWNLFRKYSRTALEQQKIWNKKITQLPKISKLLQKTNERKDSRVVEKKFDNLNILLTTIWSNRFGGF